MKLKDEKGQSLVEFALVVPILFLIIAIIIDFGWVYSCQISAENVARQAARYIAVHNDNGSLEVLQNTAESVIATTANQKQLPTERTAVTVSFSDVDSDSINDSIKVYVHTEVDYLTGVTSMFTGKTYANVSASSIMKLEN
jgi:Flp pilus assembly protein TadG